MIVDQDITLSCRLPTRYNQFALKNKPTGDLEVQWQLLAHQGTVATSFLLPLVFLLKPVYNKSFALAGNWMAQKSRTH